MVSFIASVSLSGKLSAPPSAYHVLLRDASSYAEAVKEEETIAGLHKGMAGQKMTLDKTFQHGKVQRPYFRITWHICR